MKAQDAEARALAAEQRESGAVEQLKRLFARVAELEGQLNNTQPPALPSEPVTAAIRRLLDEREAKGIATYGRTLGTFNGRDSLQDELEEFIDGFQYRMQYRMERQRLDAHLWAVESRLGQAEALLSETKLVFGIRAVEDWLARRDAFLKVGAAEPVPVSPTEGT